MAFFVIAGKEGCLRTVHALFVAENLSKYLPHFRFRSVLIPEAEWPTWLDQMNSTHNWHETESPVIWKEVNRRGGKKYLIGCLEEFWEYCYDYYGFQTKMSEGDLTNIMADYLLISSKSKETTTSIVCIIGGSDRTMLELTVYEIQKSHDLTKGEIRIYDQRLGLDPDEEDLTLELVEGLRNTLKITPQSINLMCSQQEAIKNCDLLVLIEDYSRFPDEEANAWLERCRKNMLLLADDINFHAKPSLRVILNHYGPVCFNASVLLEYCTQIELANIVAVTADEGFSIISMMAEKIGERVENFWCPPVWGFSGLKSYVTLVASPITSEVIRPYKRSLKTKESSCLPKGEIQREIRYLGNLIQTDDFYKQIEDRKAEELRVLQRPPILPKIRALGSLLRLWFAAKIGDDIIPLGIRSDGSFGFPEGICFSQAACLNEHRIWEPASNFPMHTCTANKIQEISLEVENTLQQFGLMQQLSSVDK